MSENLKLFLQKVAEDTAWIEENKSLTDKDAGIEAAIAKAAELGIELTPEDFVPSTNELSENELEAVAGGATDKQCSCIVGGGGADDSWDEVCACVVMGLSSDTLCFLIGME